MKLAFEKWHMEQEDALGAEVEAQAHARRIVALRTSLRTMPVEVA